MPVAVELPLADDEPAGVALVDGEAPTLSVLEALPVPDGLAVRVPRGVSVGDGVPVVAAEGVAVAD